MTFGPGSLSARRAWIEILISRLPRSGTVSLSARRAWIEIKQFFLRFTTAKVALRKESVDRNLSKSAIYRNLLIVALRKESVDRNWQDIDERETISVALRKESVDRNMGVGTTRDSLGGRSPQGERG